MVCKNVYDITRKSYKTPDTLLNFNEKRYRKLYRDWGVLGAMENIINTAIDYTEDREQFSKSLNSFQLIQNDLIKSIELYTNSLNNSFASLNSIETFEDLEKNIALISYLKRTNCENAINVARICRDILGGNGVSNSYNKTSYKSRSS